jgi:HlyD family secretion protein
MNRPSSKLILSISLVAIISLVFWYTSQPEPVKVTVKPVTRGKVENTVTNTRAGTVRSCKRARLAPATAGQISRLLVSEGDKVEAGALLLEIWNEDIKAEVLLSEQQTRATVSQSREACVTADVAEKEASRVKTLRKKKLASDEDTERAVGNAQAKRAACRAAQANIQVSEAKTQLAQAQLQRTQLHAPFAGIVAEVNGEIGEFATPSPIGVPTLPTIDLFNQNCVYVVAPIDEVDAPALKKGMQTRISLDAFSDRAFSGSVRRIAPYVLDIEKQARTVDIEVDFVNKEDIAQLMPGYSADAEVIIEIRDKVLRIPTEAIKDENTVLVHDPDDRILEQRSIKKGISNWIYTEVLSGLQEGEQVVTSIDRKGVEAGVEAVAE